MSVPLLEPGAPQSGCLVWQILSWSWKSLLLNKQNLWHLDGNLMRGGWAAKLTKRWPFLCGEPERVHPEVLRLMNALEPAKSKWALFISDDILLGCRFHSTELFAQVKLWAEPAQRIIELSAIPTASMLRGQGWSNPFECGIGHLIRFSK